MENRNADSLPRFFGDADLPAGRQVKRMITDFIGVNQPDPLNQRYQ
jgi:hypothetical protein